MDFQKCVVSLASHLNRNSEEADFWTQNVIIKLLCKTKIKIEKFKKLDPLLRFRHFCQKWTKSQILKNRQKRAVFGQISPEQKSMKKESQMNLHAKNEAPEISQMTWGPIFVFSNPPL